MPARPGRARLGMTLEPLLGSTVLCRAADVDVDVEEVDGEPVFHVVVVPPPGFGFWILGFEFRVLG